MADELDRSSARRPSAGRDLDPAAAVEPPAARLEPAAPDRRGRRRRRRARAGDPAGRQAGQARQGRRHAGRAGAHPSVEAAAARGRGRQHGPRRPRARLSGPGALAPFPLPLSARWSASTAPGKRGAARPPPTTRRAGWSRRSAPFPYDTLVLAIGSRSNDFGTPGVAEHAIALDTPSRRRASTAGWSMPACAPTPRPSRCGPGQLHVAIIGAGATGTELAAELHRTARAVVAYRPRSDRPREGHQDHPDRGGADASCRRCPSACPRRPRSCCASSASTSGPSARVTEVRADGVQLADGGFIPSELVVWAAGRARARTCWPTWTGSRSAAATSSWSRPTLQTTRDPDIFAIGDCAFCPRRGRDGRCRRAPRPPTSRRRHVVRQIRRRLRGRAAEAVRLPRLRLAGVAWASTRTVGSLMGFIAGKGMMIEGWFARLMYRSLYKMHETALHGTARSPSTRWRAS